MTSTVKGSNVTSVVVLSGKLSNPVIDRHLASLSVIEAGETPVQRAAPTSVRRRKLLGREETEALKRQYAAGQSVKQLASKLDVHHTTISAILREEGIRLRQTSLSPKEIEAARDLRSAGWSNARIAAYFGCGTETVRRRLRSVAQPNDVQLP